MQSARDGKVLTFKQRLGRTSAPEPRPLFSDRAPALPRALVNDAWWLMPALPAPKQRPRLWLVAECGRGLKP